MPHTPSHELDPNQNPFDNGSNEPTPPYELGGNNTEYWANVEFDPAAVLGNLQSQLMAGLLVRGQQNGWTRSSITQLLEGIWQDNEFGSFLDSYFSNLKREQDLWSSLAGLNLGWEVPLKYQMGPHYATQTQQGFMELTRNAWDYFNRKTSVDLGEFPTVEVVGGPTSGGPSGPTAEDIRNRFDVDELTELATDIWRGMLLTDDADTRGMAKAYIDAVVSSGGEKKIDFVEFIRNKAKATDRYKSIFANKPDSMSEEDYLSPYFASALQVTSPDEAAQLAIGGAQFGASASAFAERLRRTQASQQSAPFINEFRARLEHVNNVFGGS